FRRDAGAEIGNRSRPLEQRAEPWGRDDRASLGSLGSALAGIRADVVMVRATERDRSRPALRIQSLHLHDRFWRVMAARRRYCDEPPADLCDGDTDDDAARRPGAWRNEQLAATRPGIQSRRHSLDHVEREPAAQQ